LFLTAAFYGAFAFELVLPIDPVLHL
jgi:hypothetical protein